MTASQRNVARLPLELFENLRLSHGNDEEREGEEEERELNDPAVLREVICKKLLMSVQQQQPRSSVRDNGNEATMATSSTASSTITAVATVGLLLKTSTPMMLRILDPLLTFEECERLRYRICVHCAAVPCTALGLFQRMRQQQQLQPISTLPTVTKDGDDHTHSSSSRSSRHRDHHPAMILSTGILSLDQQLHGGIRVGTITELVGRAGVGKSQLALQLCVETALRYRQGSVYIDTEHKLQLSRLQQMAQQRSQQQQQQPDLPPSISAQDVMANVTVHTATTLSDLLTTISHLEEEILYRNAQAVQDDVAPQFPVRLIVVDSIAAPTKRGFTDVGSTSNSQLAVSAATLQCAQMLKRLACQLDLAVVVINQASVVYSPSRTMGNSSSAATSTQNRLMLPPVRAALGTAWHHCVSTRLLLDFTTTAVYDDQNDNNVENDNQDENDPPNISTRSLSILKSNLVGYSEIHYQITDRGLVAATCKQTRI